MANRRMFARSVVEVSRFLSQSHEAQLLYFHMGVLADDDGVTDTFILSMMGIATPAALEELVKNHFIKEIADNTYYILDWLTSNQIRQDRYHPSEFHQTLLDLKLIEGEPKEAEEHQKQVEEHQKQVEEHQKRIDDFNKAAAKPFTPNPNDPNMQGVFVDKRFKQ